MNKQSHLLVILLVCCFCQTAFAQSTKQDVNEIKYTKKLQAKLYAINTVDEYSSLVRLSTDYTIKKFPTKFTSNASHVNDILWRNSSKFQTVNFQEYFTELKSFCNENEGISSLDIECDIQDVNLIESRTEFASDERFSISTVVLVDVIKKIQFKDLKYNLLFSGEIPLTFEVNIVEDQYGRLRSEISSVVTRDNFIPFDFSILNLGDRYELADICDIKDYGIEIEDTNEEYMLFKFKDENPEIILVDIDDKKDDQKIHINDYNSENVLIVKPQELSRVSLFASIDFVVPGFGNTDFTSSYIFSNPTNTSIDASGLVIINDILGEKFGDKGNGQKFLSKFDVLAGGSYLSQGSELRLDGLYQTSQQVDSDDFGYSRLSTYADIKETLNIKAASLTVGLQLPGLMQDRLKFRIMGSIPLILEVDYSNSCISFHEGYYEDLYGIIIDENHFYDYGVYQSFGSGVFNSLSKLRSFEYGGSVDFVFTNKLKGNKLQLHPAIRASFIKRNFSFENNSLELFEIDPETINSSTMLIDDMSSWMFKLGISFEISRVPSKITDCP